MALTDNLISWWTLNEASGTRNDSHGTNHLTDNNTVTQLPGRVAEAGDFEAGNSEYLSIADNASLQTGDIDFTFACWVAAESLAGLRTILSKFSSTGNKREYLLDYDATTSRFRFTVSNNGTTTTTVSANSLGAASVGTIYFIVAWHDATADTINIQINNGTVDSASHTTGVFVSDNEFRIGGAVASGGALAAWDGSIDEVGFWKRVLTSGERGDLYNNGYGRSYGYVSTGTPSFYAQLIFDAPAGDATTASDITTATFTPQPNSLLLVFASSRAATAATRLPSSISDTFSPNLSWTLVEDDENISAGGGVTTSEVVYRAVTGASPGSGTVTVTFNATSNRRGIIVVQIPGSYDTTTPIRQSKSNNSTATSLTVTLDSSPLSDGIVIGGVVTNNTTTVTPDTDYLEMLDFSPGSNSAVQVQYKPSGADTTVAWSGLGSSNPSNAAVVVEVQKATVAGGGTAYALTATLAGATTTNTPQLAVQRTVSATATGQTTTNTPSLAVLRTMAATLTGQTSTSPPQLTVTRAFSATLTGQSNTNAPSLAVARAMAAVLTGATSTSDASLQVAGALALVAAMTGVTSTSTPQLAVARSMAAIATGATSTGNVSLAVLRPMVATLAGATSTNAPSLAILRALSATLTGQTATGAPQLVVARALAAVLTGVTSTSVADLALAGALALVASMSAQTATSTPQLAVQRAMSATATGVTATSDITLLRLYALAATLAGATSTSTAQLAVQRALSASMTGQTDADAALAVARAFAATLTGQTSTSNAELITTIIAGLVQAIISANAPRMEFRARPSSVEFQAIPPHMTFAVSDMPQEEFST